MGRIRSRKDSESGANAAPATSDENIAALIRELEHLIVECKRIAQGEQPLDAHAIAAIPFISPCLAAPAADAPLGFPAGRARLARALIRQRRMRSEFLPPALFAEPAWDMFLDLYAAHYEGKPVAVSSLCIAANVPSSTALRSMDAMMRAGCIERSRDPNDGRRIFIALSDSARTRLDAYFDALTS